MGGRLEPWQASATATSPATTGTNMAKKNFLMLIAMAKPDAKLLKETLARLQREADEGATPAYFDGIGTGIFMTTHLSAKEVMSCILPPFPTHDQREAFREAHVLEIGPETWSSSTSSKPARWLNSHRAPPARPEGP
jgi:hypothetical protein